MALFFSWRKILRDAGKSSKRIICVLKAINSKRLPKNKWDPIYPYYSKDYSGKSFLLDLESLLTNEFRYKPREIAEYIALASLRSYSYYKLTKDSSLDLFHSPVDQDIINNNRLLRVKNGRIHFYYEEDLKRRNRLWL